MSRLIVVSNRLPVVIGHVDGGFRIREGAGGLVTALKPLLAQRGGAWIGFCGMFEADRGAAWEDQLKRYGEGSLDYRPVVPAKTVYDRYYLDYANQELWPRFHGMTDKMSRDAANAWPEYERMNRLFADHVREIADADSVLWLQDYHLMLLPKMVREDVPDAAIGHFLHIPFPPAELMAEQPHARQILEGVLGADLLGFHVPDYMNHFVDAAERILDCRVAERTDRSAVLEHDGRRVRLGAFPIGIQPGQLAQPDTATVKERLGDRVADRLILSMDRLDYTKAIPPRLKAFGQLLDRYPEYHEKLSLVQLLDVSRKDIPAYQEERDEVERAIADIEGRYTSWKPLHYAPDRWKRKEVAGVFALSQVAVVTPRIDGMNLVSKEYVTGAPDDGVLVLSRQTGAAWQLGEHAVLVDGDSTESIVEGLRTALEMPEDERRSRMAKLKENVRTEDVFWWARSFLRELGTDV